MARQGIWWRGALAVVLLAGGLVMWFRTDDAPNALSKLTRPLAPAVRVEAAPPSEANDGPELALARATSPAPATPTTTQPKPLRVTDFFKEPPPEPLASAYDRLNKGMRMSASDVKVLMAYDEEHPGDPRVQLLFAYDSMKLEWKRAAIGHYLEAYRMEPQAREDAHMLPDLIRLASDDTEGQRACDAIEEIFGADALPGVQDAIEDAEHENMHATAARLSALRDRLRP